MDDTNNNEIATNVNLIIFIFINDDKDDVIEKFEFRVCIFYLMGKFEFGGPIGVTVIMIWSHCLLYYFWYCITFNSGDLVYPTSLANSLEICA
jgi:hypothetical protein